MTNYFDTDDFEKFIYANKKDEARDHLTHAYFDKLSAKGKFNTTLAWVADNTPTIELMRLLGEYFTHIPEDKKEITWGIALEEYYRGESGTTWTIVEGADHRAALEVYCGRLYDFHDEEREYVVRNMGSGDMFRMTAKAETTITIESDFVYPATEGESE